MYSLVTALVYPGSLGRFWAWLSGACPGKYPGLIVYCLFLSLCRYSIYPAERETILEWLVPILQLHMALPKDRENKSINPKLKSHTNTSLTFTPL